MSGARRVAIIEPVGGHGGMDYYDLPLCESIAACSYDVVLHTCDKTINPGFSSYKVEHTYAGMYDHSPFWRRAFKYLTGAVKSIVSAVLADRKICHFHLFHVDVVTFFCVLLARVTFRKVVITSHDVESFSSKHKTSFTDRAVYRLAHTIIAHNNTIKKELIRCLNVLDEKISVIPSGNYLHVVADPPSYESSREWLGIPRDAKVLLFFGQIKDVKRLDLLISSMPTILSSHPDAILLIAGRPWHTDFARYQALIDQFDIDDSCINHIKFIRDEDLPYYYMASDLVVLPYQRIYQSAVVLMAMSYGKAVVVSDHPSMIELVTHKQNGFVFELEKPGDLAKKISDALSDRRTLDWVAENGLNTMAYEYNWERVGEMTTKLYDGLIGY